MNFLQKYRQFHGTDPTTIKKISIDIPEDGILIEIGDLTALEYQVQDKNSDKSDYVYRHDFKKPPKLATNSKGDSLYIIGKTKVAKWIYN